MLVLVLAAFASFPVELPQSPQNEEAEGKDHQIEKQVESESLKKISH